MLFRRRRMKYKCPCCGYFTFESKPGESYDICEVCYWEDDPVQLADPTFEGGANLVSLRQARANYKAFGASSREVLSLVRKPRRDER